MEWFDHTCTPATGGRRKALCWSQCRSDVLHKSPWVSVSRLWEQLHGDTGAKLKHKLLCKGPAFLLSHMDKWLLQATNSSTNQDDDLICVCKCFWSACLQSSKMCVMSVGSWLWILPPGVGQPSAIQPSSDLPWGCCSAGWLRSPPAGLFVSGVCLG